MANNNDKVRYSAMNNIYIVLEYHAMMYCTAQYILVYKLYSRTELTTLDTCADHMTIGNNVGYIHPDNHHS